MANKLTETEALAKCLAQALHNNPPSFGAEQGRIASEAAATLFSSGQLDAPTFGRVSMRLGNHSANLQWAVKHGFIIAQPDALSNAVSEEIAAIKEREASILAPAKKP